jgi:hypothetical protein
MSHRDTPELRDGQELTAQDTSETPSKTPRTDAEEIDLSESIKVELQSTGRRRVVEKYVTAKFARQLEIELSQERERGRWIPTSERLPEPERVVVDGAEEACDFVPVLFYTEHTVCAGRFWPVLDRGKKNKFRSLQGVEYPLHRVTHWQPLPSAPGKAEE